MLHYSVMKLRQQQEQEQEQEQEQAWENRDFEDGNLDVSQDDMKLIGGGDSSTLEGGRSQQLSQRRRRKQGKLASGPDQTDLLFKVAVLGALSATCLWAILTQLQQKQQSQTKFAGRTVTWWLAAAAPFVLLGTVLFVGLPISILLVNGCFGEDEDDEDDDQEAEGDNLLDTKSTISKPRFFGTGRKPVGVNSGLRKRVRRDSRTDFAGGTEDGSSTDSESSGNESSSSEEDSSSSSGSSDEEDAEGLVNAGMFSATPSIKKEE